MKINNCKCGSSNVEFVKIFEKNMYDGFVRCNDCGCEGRIYTSKQNAVKAWNKGKVEIIPSVSISDVCDKIDELEKKYVEQYGCEIVEMYADIVSELKEWLRKYKTKCER